MSKFLNLVLGAAKSNTVQINSLFLVLWQAVIDSQMIQSNPELVKIMVGLQAVANILLRFKTSKPLSQR